MGRALLNIAVRKHCSLLSGEVLDLAGTKDASYHRHLPQGLSVVTANRMKSKEADVAVDFNKPLPFADGQFDAVLFFNAIYIVDDRTRLYKEIKRILKGRGLLVASSPFIANEMPEPHDYCRLTYEGLERELSRAGFRSIQIERFGERFSAAAHLLHPAFFISPIRVLAYPLALLLDWLIPTRVRQGHPAPIGYFCIAKK